MNATQAKAKMAKMIRGLTTDQLIEGIIKLNLATSSEEILVCCKMETELESRMSEAEFVEFMQALESELNAA
jgi:hypothetical protein